MLRVTKNQKARLQEMINIMVLNRRPIQIENAFDHQLAEMLIAEGVAKIEGGA